MSIDKWLLQVYSLIGILFVKINASPLDQFIQVPNIMQIMSFYAQTSVVATKVQDCIPLIKPSTLALVFMPSIKNCTALSKVFVGYNLRVTGVTYYLRMPGKCGACASTKEAKNAILSYTYQQNACPDTFFTYDEASGYCVGKVTDQIIIGSNPYFTNYAAYTQGVYRNKTLLVMSRGMASRALTFKCPQDISVVSTFNGVWYCYTQVQINTTSVAYITQNYCVKWITDGTAVKFVHLAEPGYLSMRNGANSYTGIVRSPSGTYKYYDGSTVTGQYLTWASGRPIAKQLVYIDLNLNLVDYDATRLTRIMCRSPATAT